MDQTYEEVVAERDQLRQEVARLNRALDLMGLELDTSNELIIALCEASQKARLYNAEELLRREEFRLK